MLDWEFDNKTGRLSIKAEDNEFREEKEYSFKLIRYKDNKTHEESLRIESLHNNKKNGYIDTYIYNLDKDLKKLMKYGVAFSKILYVDLQQQIENVYLQLKEDYSKSGNEDGFKSFDEDKLKEFLKMIGEFIKEFDFKNGCYHIPVEQFNLLVEESVYSDYDIKQIKEELSKVGYIKCGQGRLTNLVRIGNKPIRVISFDKKMLVNNNYITIDDEDNKTAEVTTNDGSADNTEKKGKDKKDGK